METWQTILSISGAVIALAVVAGTFLANSKNTYTEKERSNNGATIQSYEAVLAAKSTEIEQLRIDIKELHKLNNESVKQNGILQGQLDAYTRLPLQEISNNQRIITQVQLLMAKHLGIEGIDVLMQELNRPSQTQGKV